VAAFLAKPVASRLRQAEYYLKGKFLPRARDKTEVLPPLFAPAHTSFPLPKPLSHESDRRALTFSSSANFLGLSFPLKKIAEATPEGKWAREARKKCHLPFIVETMRRAKEAPRDKYGGYSARVEYSRDWKSRRLAVG